MANCPDVGLAPLVVDLVDDDHHGRVAVLQHARDLRVLLGDAGRDVDDEHDEVGVAHRRVGLRAHLGRERRLLAGEARSPRSSQPPVSTTRNARPFHSATSSLRSRVTPGRSSTIAARRPTMRFTSVDLPTFGPADDGDDGQLARAVMPRSRPSAQRVDERRRRRSGRSRPRGQLGDASSPSRKRPRESTTSGSR